MKAAQREYSEFVIGDEDAIASYCEVQADDYFVRVITDTYEGSAQMHVSVARKLGEALRRAVEHVEAMQAKAGGER